MQYLRSEQVLNNILSIRIKIYMKERGCCLDHNSCIYQIKNKINGKKYIGQTSDFQKRKNSHLSALRRGKCFNSYLQRAFDVYGEDAFEFSILEYCDVDDLDKREEFWISREGSYRLCGGESAEFRERRNQCGQPSDLMAVLFGEEG